MVGASLFAVSMVKSYHTIIAPLNQGLKMVSHNDDYCIYPIQSNSDYDILISILYFLQCKHWKTHK